MATAPQRNNKRTRFDTSGSHQSRAMPLASFKDVVSNHCESLQPSLRDILNNSAVQQFLTFMHTANQKKRAVVKMETDIDYVPRSVKLNCELFCTKLAQQDAEYTNLAETLAESVNTFEISAKVTIINGVKLDVKVHLHAAKRTLCEAIYKASKAYITLNDLNLQHVHKYANTIMDRHHEDITPIFSLDDFSTKEQLKSCYIEFTSGEAPLPVPFIAPDNLPRANNQNGIPAAVAPVINPYKNAAAAANNQNANRQAEDTLDLIWRSIRTCFLDAWAAYLRQQKANDDAIRMKKMSTELLTTEATAATAMQVDQEAALSPAALSALVQQEVQKATAPLTNTIRSLESKLKNSTGGHRGPSHRTQRPGRGGRHRGGRGGRTSGHNASRTPRQAVPEAADAAAASNRNPPGNTPNNSRELSTNRRRSSPNNGNRRRSRSGRRRN